ncbi:MAG: penicillin-insensitive murein endopeptidase, partial [Pseudobdellovibrio sp.]
QPAPTPSPVPVPSKTEATKEQVIDLNFKIDRSGNVIRHNQAFGSYSGGYLRNASSLKEQQDSFNQKHLYYFHDNGRYYGTQEAVEIVQLMGKKIYQAERNKIYVSRIAAQRGGLIRPSKSHQNGLDIDIGYPTKSGKTKFPVVVASGGSKIISSDYSPAKTLELFKFLVTQKQYPVSRLFVDRHIIKNLCSYARETKQTENNQKAVIAKVFSILQHVDGHGNHFHLRLKCDSKRHKCLDVYYSKRSICTTSSMVVK